MRTSEDTDAGFNNIRAYVGGVFLAVGIIGFAVGFIILMMIEPMGGFAVGNWNGDAPQPSEAQKEAAIKRVYQRMIPYFACTSIFVLYGVYEGMREKQGRESMLK
jgi:hypothetical protein